VSLDPVVSGWDWLDALTVGLDSDAATAAAEEPGPQERPALDALFR